MALVPRSLPRDVGGDTSGRVKRTRFVLYDFIRRDAEDKKDFGHDSHSGYRACHPHI